MAEGERHDPGLLEREAELGVLRGAVGAARSGAGGVLLVEGAAGVGKSSLLRALRAEGEARGLQVRVAVGGELEREFGFGIVRQLLEAVVRGASEAEREELLAGAAAVAGPLLGVAPQEGEVAPDGSFVALHGLYWLVAALAERAPLLLVVDDAHWADEPSLRFCDFLARRATELPLLLALGLRPDEPGAAHDLLAGIADAPSADTLRPGSLSSGATGRLVAEGLGEEVAEEVVRSAHDATGGNPLLLRELIRTLAAWDGEPTAEVVRAAVPSSVTRSVLRRLRRLPPATQATARALAVLGDRLPADVLAAAAGLEPDAVTEALGQLHVAQLVDGDPPGFVHPLVRQAVAEPVGPVDRSRLHGRVAQELRGRPGAEEQVVVHLLAAPPLGEPWVVPALRAAAERAVADGAADLALHRLRRAEEELGPDDPQAAAVALELGLAQIAQGDPEAIGQLGRAAEAEDPTIAARAIGTQLGVGGVTAPSAAADAVARCRALLVRLTEAGELELRDALQAQLLNVLTLDTAHAEQRAALMEEVWAHPTAPALHMLCVDAAAGDATREEALELVRRAVSNARVGLAGLESHTISWTATAAGLLEDPKTVQPVLFGDEGRGFGRTSPLAVAFRDYMRAMWHCRFGSAALGEALARGAHERFADFEGAVMELSVRSEVIHALTLLGRLDEADALVAGVGDADFEGLALVECTWTTRRAQLRLAQGRLGEALADHRRVEAVQAGWGWKRFVLGYGQAQIARLLVAAGEREEGRARAEAEVADAARRGVAGQEAMALVALGHALEGDAALEAFAAAAEAGERCLVLPVRSAALLEHGAALRRAGVRTDARRVLARAADAADRADAAGLVERARAELAVAGGRPRRVAVSGVASLTPSERRVAEHAARGLTNREIAEQLFVTRKTVESTLGNAFAKLDIRSRTQLAGVLASPDAAGPGA